MSDNWQAGERRGTDQPVTYKPSRVPGGSPVRYGYGNQGPTVVERLRARLQNLAATQANWNDRMKLQQQQRVAQWAAEEARLEADAERARNRITNRSDAQQRALLEAQWAAAQPDIYNGAGSAGNLYGAQGQAYGAARAAATAQAQAVGPTGTFTNNNYNGAGSAANLYAQQAQATYAKQTGQQWYNLRKQQAAYKANINVAPDPNNYYFGPGSMEQFYATQAYANAPINVPTVPNTNYGGGSYGGGYGSGGGGSYVAAEPDIPRWLYGMLNWRYR